MERAARPGRPAGHTTVSRKAQDLACMAPGYLHVPRSLAVYLAALSKRCPGRGSFPLPSFRILTPLCTRTQGSPFPCCLVFENTLQTCVRGNYLFVLPRLHSWNRGRNHAAQRVTLKVTEGSRDGETRVGERPFVLLLEKRAWMPRSGTSNPCGAVSSVSFFLRRGLPRGADS